MHGSATNRLKSLQEKGKNECTQTILRLENSIKQLESVKLRLKSLPDKTRYGIQVPVGSTIAGQPPLLLMKGYIKHTNEFLVLLGDNWFVERSAKESIDIIERRILKTKAVVEKFNQEKQQHQQFINLVQSMEDERHELVEIKEDFDEEQENKWREDHRRRVKESKLKENETRNQEHNQEDDLDLMTRLQLLEEEEELHRQEDIPEKKTLRQQVLTDSLLGAKGQQECKTELKGILKKTMRDDVHKEDARCSSASSDTMTAKTGHRQRKEEPQDTSSPFTGQVVERQPLCQHSDDLSKECRDREQEKRPISRFKASRMKK